MLSRMKKLFLILLIVLFFPPLLTVKAETTQTQESENSIAALVDGKPIFWSQVEAQMTTLNMMYQNLSGSLSDEEIAEKKLKAKSEILDKLIEQLVVQNKLASLGFIVTDEIKTQAEESYQSTVKVIEDYVKKSYPDISKEDLEETAQWILSNQGLSKESIVESAIQNALFDAYKKQIEDETDRMDESAVKAYYNSLYSEQKESFSNDINLYEQALLSGKPVIFRPVETRVIKQLSIPFDDDVIDLINQLNAYGSKDEAEKMRMDQYDRISAKLNQTMDRLKSGESFDALIEEFSEGSDAVNYVSEQSTRFSEEFKNAAMSIETLGQFSEPIKTAYGYLILCWDATLEAADPVAFEDVRADLESLLSEFNCNRAIADQKMQWLKEANIEIFEDGLK
ncbi:protein containing PPIC-type PPIASE domain [Flexilinea flocculi]|jgi:ribosomal protein S7|uniref:Protein containing PPIC-type PPIASE domain n=2 Tax=Flexilinea flocculi TaxID=1678840 RepID=A0A0K8PCS1_9CHLR|nr:protein containing PPIC-type PPIASE domain [Flexilinea flocculi]